MKVKNNYSLFVKSLLIFLLIINSAFLLSSCEITKEEKEENTKQEQEKDSSQSKEENKTENKDEEKIDGQKELSKEEKEVQKWREDLEQLKHDITWYNSAPFERYGEKAFEDLYEEIYNGIPNLSNYQREYRLRELLYSIGDGHIDMWTDKEYELTLPIMIDELEDGYYVINASEKYKNMIGERVLTINGHSIDEIISKFELISNGESDYWRRAGAIDKIHQAYFYKLLNMQYKEDKFIQVNQEKIRCVPLMLYFSTDWEKELEIGEMPNGLARGYYSYELPYEYDFLEDGKILHVKFSSCNDEIEGYPLYDFGKDVLEEALKKKPEVLLLDLRDNGGGSPSALYAAFSEKFFKETGFLNSPKFFIVTNRNTFSAGVTTTHLVKNKFGATHIGTPTGGSPFTTNVSETANKVLKNTKINFRISSAKVRKKMIETPSEIPDIEIKKTSGDLINDRDPIIEFAKEQLE